MRAKGLPDGPQEVARGPHFVQELVLLIGAWKLTLVPIQVRRWKVPFLRTDTARPRGIPWDKFFQT